MNRPIGSEILAFTLAVGQERMVARIDPVRGQVSSWSRAALTRAGCFCGIDPGEVAAPSIVRAPANAIYTAARAASQEASDCVSNLAATLVDRRTQARARHHGFGGEVAISTTSVSVPVFSMPCSHHGGR